MAVSDPRSRTARGLDRAAAVRLQQSLQSALRLDQHTFFQVHTEHPHGHRVERLDDPEFFVCGLQRQFVSRLCGGFADRDTSDSPRSRLVCRDPSRAQCDLNLHSLSPERIRQLRDRELVQLSGSLRLNIWNHERKSHSGAVF